MKSRLGLGIAACGWLFAIFLLAYRQLELKGYLGDYEATAFYALLIFIPFVYTFLGYMVAEREHILERLRESEEDLKNSIQSLQLFEKTLETMQLGVTVVNSEGKIIYCNPADAEMHGYSVDELTGQEARIFAHSELQQPMTKEQIKEIKSWRRECINIRKDGSIFPVILMSDVIVDAEGDAIGVITICEDITCRKQFEEKIANLSYYDTLTSLPNRFLFSDRMKIAIAVAARHERMMALLFIDLDHFKRVNDTFGHGMGDRLLQKVADRLTKCIRISDSVGRLSLITDENLVARFGGDEFIVLLSEVEQLQEVEIVARRIIDVLSEPLWLDDRELFINASVGIALFPRDGTDFETLMRKADMAMFYAKESGRNGYYFYSDSLRTMKSARYIL